MAMTIDSSLCTACGECETNCPTGAIKAGKGTYIIDPATCTECEGVARDPKCLMDCLSDAIAPA